MVPEPAAARSIPTIRPLASPEEAHACADLMASMDPWVRFGRTRDQCYAIVTDPARETYVAVDDAGDAKPGVAGFAVIVMQGVFVGYIQSLAVRPDRWGRGLGTALIQHVERRILREQPNVYICASSFNPDARRLYERLGYQAVGELTDWVIRGHSEILLRKTIGPLAEFTPRGPERA